METKPKTTKPALYLSRRFYECGCCGAWHNDAWHGDCRQDNARFDLEEIEAAWGYRWEEVPMVPGEPLVSEL